MKFDKAVNFFTFMVISLPTALQNETAHQITCTSDELTIYPHFLFEAGIIMNEHIIQRNLVPPVSNVAILESYLAYAMKNLNIMGNIENTNDLCIHVSEACQRYLVRSASSELVTASFLEEKPSPLLINPGVNVGINPPDFAVIPEFSKLLPKTTTIRCIPSRYNAPGFYITKFSDLPYPIFVFKSMIPQNLAPIAPRRRHTRIPTDDNKTYFLALLVIPEDELSRNIRSYVYDPKTSQLPQTNFITEKVS